MNPNSFFDDSQQQEALRRRRLGQQLQKVGAPQQSQMVGGLVVPQSTGEHFARALASGLGTYQNARADTLEADAKKNEQAALSEALTKYGSDPEALAGVLVQNPKYAGTAVDLLARSNQNKLDAERREADYERRRADNESDFQRRATLERELRTMELEREDQKRADARQEKLEDYSLKSGKSVLDAEGNVVPNPEPPKPPLTKGQEAVDKAFADEYVKLQASGGLADIDKRVEQLREAQQALTSGENLTGAWTGLIPEFAEPALIPSSVEAREAVEEVVQRNLREVLGAQFTEKEGNRLIARAFNPKLTEEENSKRVGRLVNQIESALQSKRSAIEYFEKEGTLVGWDGKLPSLSDFGGEGDAASAQSDPLAGARDAIARGADPEAVKQRLLDNGIDPAGL